MRPPPYVMDTRPRPTTAPPPPTSGQCQTCGHWAPYLVVILPDTRWRCVPCAEPAERSRTDGR